MGCLQSKTSSNIQIPHHQTFFQAENSYSQLVNTNPLDQDEIPVFKRNHIKSQVSLNAQTGSEGSIRATEIEDLPPEVIHEILSRLPNSSLFQTWYVFRYWRTMISTLHYNSSVSSPNPTSLILFNLLDSYSVYHIPDFFREDIFFYKAIKLDYLPFRALLPVFTVVGSCNGIICLADNSKFVIFNPVNGDFTHLPKAHNPPHFCGIFYGFGYDQCNKKYKVVRGLRSLHCRESLKFEILTVGSYSWRPIGTITRNISEKEANGVFLNGNLHWLLIDNHGKVIGVKTFNVEDESFGTLDVPTPIKGKTAYNYCTHFGVLGGCLMMVDYSEERKQELWVMKDEGLEKSWTIESVFPDPEHGVKQEPLGMLTNGNLLLEGGRMPLFSYDPITKKHDPVWVSGLPDLFHFKAVLHVATLVRLKDVIVVEGR